MACSSGEHMFIVFLFSQLLISCIVPLDELPAGWSACRRSDGHALLPIESCSLFSITSGRGYNMSYTSDFMPRESHSWLRVASSLVSQEGRASRNSDCALTR